MRSLQVLTVSGAGVPLEIPCQDGERVRVVALGILLSGPDTAFDQVITQFLRSGQLLFELTTNPLSGNCANISAAIGAAQSAEQETLIDPVTGAVTLQGTTRATFALPDIWFPWSFNIAVGAAVAPATLTALYEVDRPILTGPRQPKKS